VQGCRVHGLGSIRYAATCSPAFHAHYFSRGVTAQALAVAPVLVFNRKDAMPIRFAERVARGRSAAAGAAGEGGVAPALDTSAGQGVPPRGASTASWHPPFWWLPSTHAVVRASVAGLGWTMNPMPLIQQHLDDGTLVLLRARAYEDVPLYWQHWRLRSDVMDTLTDCVLDAARVLVRRGRAGG
jgi:LysR family transcriptional regulator (chromosome initiation inhibitor)